MPPRQGDDRCVEHLLDPPDERHVLDDGQRRPSVAGSRR
jgi:hypothetical protein